MVTVSIMISSFILLTRYNYVNALTPLQCNQLIFGGFLVFILSCIVLHLYYKHMERVKNKVLREAVDSLDELDYYLNDIVSVRTEDSVGSLDNLILS